MKLYGLKTCDSCKKALKTLANRGYAVEYVDVRKDGVPADIMIAAFGVFGNKLVNKSSTTWRALSDIEKQGDFLALLQENPTLMKRPLIVTGSDMTLGWKQDAESKYPDKK